MYYISKNMEIAACHKLTLSYESKCARMHGHNWKVTVFCKAKELNKDGMVIDFKHVKEKIHGYLDHGNLNELLPSILPQRTSPDGLSHKFPSATRQGYKKARGT